MIRSCKIYTQEGYFWLINVNCILKVDIIGRERHNALVLPTTNKYFVSISFCGVHDWCSLLMYK